MRIALAPILLALATASLHAGNLAHAEDAKTNETPSAPKDAAVLEKKSAAPNELDTRGQIPEGDDYCDAVVPPCPMGCKEDTANKICIEKND